MNEQVKLFDSNDQLVDNFEDIIENIEISIHGVNYYDVDVELVDTNLIPSKEVEKEAKKLDEEIKVKSKKQKFSFKDLLPLLFFVLMFVIVLFAGFYFINEFDLGALIK